MAQFNKATGQIHPSSNNFVDIVMLASSSGSIVGTGAGCYATATFTPSASAYGALDIIDTPKEFAFSYTNGGAVPVGSLIRVLSTIIRIDQTALQASEGAYTLSCYDVTPPSAKADNAVWALESADLAAYRGDLALGTPVDKGAASFIKTQHSDQQDIRLLSSSSSMWGQLITTPAFTPGAVARQVTIYGVVM